MKIILSLALLGAMSFSVSAQNRKANQNKKLTVTAAPVAVVTDERLAVVREAPRPDATVISRVRRGRQLTVSGSTLAAGVGYYRVNLSGKRRGWIQREALSARGRRDDDVRLARLIMASSGFERLDRGRIFLELFPDSPLRPQILLDVGERAAEFAVFLTRTVRRGLRDREMAASDASPEHFFRNHVALDRFSRIGIRFEFDSAERRFLYDGSAWREILRRFPASPEAAAAKQKLTETGRNFTAESAR